MSTCDNLQAAFAGESQASRKYLAFAKKAEQDGFPQVAKLFRAASEAETIHAQRHLRALNGIADTAANLEAAAGGEKYEFESMYPPFLAEAEQTEQKAAIKAFKYALEAEKVHYDLYNQALASVKEGKDLAADSVWVCVECGHTVIGEAPDKCPICGAGKKFYTEIK